MSKNVKINFSPGLRQTVFVIAPEVAVSVRLFLVVEKNVNVVKLGVISDKYSLHLVFRKLEINVFKGGAALERAGAYA